LYGCHAPYPVTCLEQCFTANERCAENADAVWVETTEREAIDASSFMRVTTVRSDGDEEREGVLLRRMGDGSVTVATLAGPRPELEMPPTLLFPGQQTCLFLHAILRGQCDLTFAALHPKDDSYAASARSDVVPPSGTGR
jgi:hypothetical protein